MLWHRIRGLWNTYHGILAVVLTLVFWNYLAIMSLVLKDSATPDFQRFILYNLAAVAGLVFAAIRGRSAATLLAGVPLDLWIICRAICQVIKPPNLAG